MSDPTPLPDQRSRGYDMVAQSYAELRSDAGLEVVRDWAEGLAPGASVLDLGAGTGEPLTRALVEAGLDVRAVDASPNMVAAFRPDLPDVPVTCEDALDGPALDGRYDGILAVGLIFLLSEAEQVAVIARIANALKPAGRVLFSAPHQVCAWEDVLTGRPSRSLGVDAYQRQLERHGLRLRARHTDAGGNHYIEALRP